MPFEIKMHPQERIIEVVYPAQPTSDDVGEYLVKMKDLIDGQQDQWFCLVDQRALTHLSPALLDQVAVANSYAVIHGMQRSARVVSSTEAALQANSIARTGAIKVKVKTFIDRDAALVWLRANTD